MQPTVPQIKPSHQHESPTEKKPYHSPSLRAAGSVREETGASAAGTVHDGSNTFNGRPLYSYGSPI